MNSVFSRSGSAFNSGNIRIISQNAGIDFTWTGDNIPGISTRSEAGIAGSITVEASGDITKNALDGEIRSWSDNGGKAGNVKIASSNGKVLLGKTSVRAWADVNDAGNVKIEADGDIEIGAITSNVVAGAGNGGDISFISADGDLLVGWIRSDSTLGKGGNVRLKSFKDFIVDNGEWIDGIDYSIYALGGVAGGSIEIVYGGGEEDESLLFFDTSTKGFQGAISNDIDQIILSTSIIPASFTLDNSVVDSEGNNIVEGALGDKTLVAGLPREGVNGNWQDPLNRANGKWIPAPNSEVAKILQQFNRTFIEFRNGFPVFEPFKQAEVTLPQLGKTPNIDKNLADKLYAEQKGWLKPNGNPDIARVQSLRSTNNLIWHHVENSTKLQLIPEKINKIPHSGGRATFRGSGGGGNAIGGVFPSDGIIIIRRR